MKKTHYFSSFLFFLSSNVRFSKHFVKIYIFYYIFFYLKIILFSRVSDKSVNILLEIAFPHCCEHILTRDFVMFLSVSVLKVFRISFPKWSILFGNLSQNRSVSVSKVLRISFPKWSKLFGNLYQNRSSFSLKSEEPAQS